MNTNQSNSYRFPPGVYLPHRAWRTATCEITLLLKVADQWWTYAFTPADFEYHRDAGRNTIRDEGVTAPTITPWPSHEMPRFYELMKQMGFSELVAQDFRVHSTASTVEVIGKPSAYREDWDI